MSQWNMRKQTRPHRFLRYRSARAVDPRTMIPEGDTKPRFLEIIRHQGFDVPAETVRAVEFNALEPVPPFGLLARGTSDPERLIRGSYPAGGGPFGPGLSFFYGDTSAAVGFGTVVHAYLAPQARVIGLQEAQERSQAYRVGATLWAAAQGYDAVDVGLRPSQAGKVLIVLNRGALVVRGR